MEETLKVIRESINNAEIIESPFPYVIIDNFIDDSHYQNLIKGFPERSKFRQQNADRPRYAIGLGHYGQVCERKCSCCFEKGLMSEQWENFARALISQEHLSFWIKKFESYLKKRVKSLDLKYFSMRGEINKDEIIYKLDPHTDSLAKAITILIYLPADLTNLNLGTTIYESKLRSWKSWIPASHDPSQFNKIMKVGFKPNRVLAFVKTDNSWHGVEELVENVDRNTIQISILVDHKRNLL